MVIDHEKAMDMAMEETTKESKRDRLAEVLKMSDVEIVEGFEESEFGQMMLSLCGVESFDEIAEDEALCSMFLYEMAFTEEGNFDASALSHLEDHEIRVLLHMIANKQPDVLLLALEDPHFPDDPRILEIFKEAKKIAKAQID